MTIYSAFIDNLFQSYKAYFYEKRYKSKPKNFIDKKVSGTIMVRLKLIKNFGIKNGRS